MQSIVDFILKGRIQAALITSLAAVISFYAPFSALISSAAIGLVTLRKGWVEAITVIAISAIPVAFMLQADLGRTAIAIPLLFFLSFPTVLINYLLDRFHSQGVAILAAALVSISFVLLLRLTFQDIDLFWSEWLGNTVKYVKGATVSGFSREGSLPFVTGLIASTLTICMILTALVSRWLQSGCFNPGGFYKEFQALRIPKGATWFTLATLLGYLSLSYGEGNLLSELLMISVIAYTFQGLAMLHGATKTVELPRMWLLIAYLSLFLLPRFTMVMLALIGIADSHFDFRNWKSNKKEEI